MKLFLLAFLFTISTAFGQQKIDDLTSKKITVNGKIEVNSTTLASRPCPIMTEAQRNLISSPAESACVYNSTTKSLNVWNGTAWGSVGGGLSLWATAKPYAIGDVVIESNKIYRCLIAHTSGTFATDLASGDWVELSAGITSSGTINDNRLVRYDGTTGTIIQSSNAVLDDSGNLTGINNATINGNFNLIGDATFKTSLTGLAKLASGVLSASALVDADVDPAAAIAVSKLGLLSGYVSGAGVVSSTDSVQSAIQKVDGNVSSLAASATTAINGKQSLSTITAKGGLYAGTGTSTTAMHPAGANGEIIVYDSTNARGMVNQKPGYIDTESAIQFTGIEDLAFNWTSGNNATFFGGVASLGGTFAKDCTSASISQKCSYVYTQAAGSLNDWIASSLVSIPSKYRAPNTVYFTFNYSYDGATGDVVPVLYSAVGSTILDMTPIKMMGATNGGVYKAVYAVNLSSTQSSLILGFHTKTLNSGKILKYNDVKITTSLSDLGIVNNTNYVNWTPFIPTFTNLGSVTVNESFYTRVGQNIYMKGRAVLGSPSGSTALISLPAGLLIDPSYLTIQSAIEGTIFNNSSSAVLTPLAIPSNLSAIGIGNITAGSGLSSIIGTAFGLSGNVISWTIGPIPIQGFDAGNAQVASTNQITSSDSMVFVQKATAIVSTDPIGTFNVFTYAGGTNNATITASAPTQSVSSMNANGIQIFARAYASSSTAASPSRVDIFIGKNLDAVVVKGYASLAKVSSLYLEVNQPSSNNTQGTYTNYDKTTGILTIDAGMGPQGTEVVRTVGRGIPTNIGPSNGYFAFTASTQPYISVIPNASLCNDYECQDDYRWFISATGVVTSTNKPGSLTCTGTTLATCTYSAALAAKLTTPMICTSGAASWAAEFTTNTVTGFQVNRFNTVSGGSAAYPTYVSCSKAWPDNKGALYKVMGVTDVYVDYYIGANQAVTGNTTPLNYNVKRRDDFNIVTSVGGGLRATIPTGKSGRYSISAKASGTTVTDHSLSLFKNGTFVTEGTYGGYVQQVVWDIDLYPGDYVEIRDGQTITLSGSATSSGFQMKRIEAF